MISEIKDFWTDKNDFQDDFSYFSEEIQRLKSSFWSKGSDLPTESVQKESQEKKPEIENQNYKISSRLTKAEKLKEWWVEEKHMTKINWIEKQITVLKLKLAKDAYVREYQDDGSIPKYLVGEQLFNWNAVAYLGLEKRLPTLKQMKAIVGNDYQAFLKKNFQRNWKNIFPGDRNMLNSKFEDIWEACRYRAPEGPEGGINGWTITFFDDFMGGCNQKWHPLRGLSLRLLKK